MKNTITSFARFCRPSRGLLAFILTTILASASFAQTGSARGVTAEDYYSFKTVSDPHFSPDGSNVAFVVTSVEQRQNRRHSDIWLVSVPPSATQGAREPVALTTAPQSSTLPRWSPDGRAIAFLSARPAASDADAGGQGTGGGAPRSQVWLLSLAGGEPRRITNLPNGVSSFQWSPDGSRLVAVSRSGPSDQAKSPSDVRHYAHANYKFNDSGWFDDKRTHLWVVDVATGRSSQITSGDDWNDSDPQWSPDNRKIAFVSDRSGKAFDDSRNTDVWVIDANGGPLAKISDHPTADNTPRWSPDGRTIAFLSSVPERSHPKIWQAPSSGGAPSRVAADGIDLIPTALRWAEGGRALYFETGVKGTSQIYRVDVEAHRASQVTSGDRTVHGLDISETSGRMVYALNDPTHLDELYLAATNGSNASSAGSLNLDQKDVTQLTHFNASLLGELKLVPVERVPYKGADGWDVDGFFMKPVGWVAGRKYPMILTIHGGPAGQLGFDWYHEFQVYASRGWAVFFTNPRGSTGYGEKFARGIEMNWGGNDYVDIMNGVDRILAKYPWIDQDRLGVTGGSYGGFMTNWIVSHTNRFKAAVTLRSISNFVSDDGTRDGAYGHSADFDGDVFEKFDLYWDRSPLKYARNVKTPTLVLHSDMDFRVPIEQGEQWFRALRHFGVPSEIVFFPRENHNLTRTGEPKHLVESLDWQVFWFDKYLNGNANAVPPDAPAKKTTTNTDERQ
ncbi:MAG TPA: S9 family peptidase [Vicinamibacterales bacterium]|nr:S9 family peptidase [Vicinamibacterales bacterium]